MREANMIEFNVKTDGKDLVDEFHEEKPTLEEVALIILRLEQIKQYLLSKEFKSKFEVREGSFAEDEE